MSFCCKPKHSRIYLRKPKQRLELKLKFRVYYQSRLCNLIWPTIEPAGHSRCETSDAVVNFILTFYGGQDSTTQEVLLGRVEHEITIEKGEDNQASMPPFETTGLFF